MGIPLKCGGVTAKSHRTKMRTRTNSMECGSALGRRLAFGDWRKNELDPCIFVSYNKICDLVTTFSVVTALKWVGLGTLTIQAGLAKHQI